MSVLHQCKKPKSWIVLRKKKKKKQCNHLKGYKSFAFSIFTVAEKLLMGLQENECDLSSGGGKKNWGRFNGIKKIVPPNPTSRERTLKND